MLLYKECKSTVPNFPPTDHYGNEIEHYVGFLKQVVNKYRNYCELLRKSIDSCNCLEYKNIKFYVDDNYEDKVHMYIELINDDDSLFVFNDGHWLHKGSWCKSIKDVLIAVDKLTKNREKTKEVIETNKAVSKTVNFLNKWEESNANV